MINGVKIIDVNRFWDDRGFFAEVWRKSQQGEMAQMSFTKTYPGVVKAFHYHEKQDDLWFCVEGNLRVVLKDLREDSPTFNEVQTIYIGEKSQAVYIPKMVAHGYKVMGEKPAKLIYLTTQEYDVKNPDEKRIPYDEFYDWKTVFK